MINPFEETPEQELRAAFREAATAFFKVMELRGYAASTNLNEIERTMLKHVGPSFFETMRGPNPDAVKIIRVMLGANQIVRNGQESEVLSIAHTEFETPEEAAVRVCGADLWASCKQFPKSRWMYEIENDETILGYWSWVVHQAESNNFDLESLCAINPELDISREALQA